MKKSVSYTEKFKFNRHELFTMDDLRLVNNLLSAVKGLNRSFGNCDHFVNMTFGIYDGVLYVDLMEFVGECIPEESELGGKVANLFHRIMDVAELVTE